MQGPGLTTTILYVQLTNKDNLEIDNLLMTVISKYTIVDREAGTSYHLPRLSMETAGLAVPAGGSLEQLFWGVVLRAPTGRPRDFIWL